MSFRYQRTEKDYLIFIQSDIFLCSYKWTIVYHKSNKKCSFKIYIQSYDPD